MRRNAQLRSKRSFAPARPTEANGPDRPFAARQDAAPRFSEAAVHGPRSIPTLVRSALRTNRTRAGAEKCVPPATPKLGNDGQRRAAMQRDFPIAVIRGGLDGLNPIRSFAAPVSDVSVAD